MYKYIFFSRNALFDKYSTMATSQETKQIFLQKKKQEAVRHHFLFSFKLLHAACKFKHRIDVVLTQVIVDISTILVPNESNLLFFEELVRKIGTNVANWRSHLFLSIKPNNAFTNFLVRHHQTDKLLQIVLIICNKATHSFIAQGEKLPFHLLRY